MTFWGPAEFRPGGKLSLDHLHERVPEAYEIDLLAEDTEARSRAQIEEWIGRWDTTSAPFDEVHQEFVSGLGFDAVAEPAPGPPLSLTQAQFLVERLLGAVIVDDEHD